MLYLKILIYQRYEDIVLYSDNGLNFCIIPLGRSTNLKHISYIYSYLIADTW